MRLKCPCELNEPDGGRMTLAGTRLSYAIGFMLASTGLVFDPTAGTAESADSVDAVTTSGTGKLTVCRNWLVTRSCSTYGRVKVPQIIGVGDEDWFPSPRAPAP